MALGKDRKRINVKGGGTLKIYELTSGGSATAMSDVGELTSVEFVDEGNMVESVNGGGGLINSQRGSQKVTLKGVLKQTSKEEIDLLRTAAGKFFHLYYQVKLDNPTTYYQELYIPLCIIKPGVSLNFQSATERTITIEVTALMPKSAVTVTPSGLNVAASEYYTLAETATTALGEVTTATGTVYTAVV